MFKAIGSGMIVAALVALLFVSSVFAIWPVVADAPWESEVAGIATDKRDEVRCEGALRLRESATEGLAAPVRSSGVGTGGATAGMSRDQLEEIRDQLTRAQKEIARYC